MLDAELVQGSLEWRLARCGKVTASRIADVVARTKTGYGASRANYMAELIVERLTGVPINGYQNEAMRWGTEQEPFAREMYAFVNGVAVEQVGFVPHPLIADCGASPDGYVGSHGLVELKAPNTATHIEILLNEKIDDRYIKQMQFQMACTGRHWCDFVSFDPRMPPGMQLFIKTVDRDPELMLEMEAEVQKFIGELEAKVATLADRYQLEAA